MATLKNQSKFRSSRQHGAVLIVALVMLAVLLLLGTSLASMAWLNEKAARNDRDRIVAFQAAQSALADAELDIENSTYSSSRSQIFSPSSSEGFAVGCNAGTTNRYQGLCAQVVDQKPAWQTVDLAKTDESSASVEFGRFTGKTMPHGEGPFSIYLPRYVIELIPDNTPGQTSARKFMYRITAIGFGSDAETQVALQAVYRKI